MGCGRSKPSRDDYQQRGNAARPIVSSPQNMQILIPRNRVDDDGATLQQVTRDIDYDVLLAALNHVSAYIAEQRQHISVMVVDGAVNVLYLRSRSTTHDIDVFGSDFSNQARILLDAAMLDAQSHIPGLGTDWLNTETQMWMSGPGLAIYAAPWSYAFSAKISRLMTDGDEVRPYDLQDAVIYLHGYIRAHGNRPVPVSTAS
ncbi:hypothetical protein EDB81DRAFT_841627 [Dactylonectria macrodidyma]|uniref:Uncharacterized protein n=1 Tax=Dactylonectria macrodidyma TaxID=307937 RepID=A0A9P9F5Z0_9HYPO|nr:hypothetical protein EDB81DRAFT_841627 [Dactylonectria macrodidyma]